jgi:hypothetical protein
VAGLNEQSTGRSGLGAVTIRRRISLYDSEHRINVCTSHIGPQLGANGEAACTTSHRRRKTPPPGRRGSAIDSAAMRPHAVATIRNVGSLFRVHCVTQTRRAWPDTQSVMIRSRHCQSLYVWLRAPHDRQGKARSSLTKF